MTQALGGTSAISFVLLVRHDEVIKGLHVVTLLGCERLDLDAVYAAFCTYKSLGAPHGYLGIIPLDRLLYPTSEGSKHFHLLTLLKVHHSHGNNSDRARRTCSLQHCLYTCLYFRRLPSLLHQARPANAIQNRRLADNPRFGKSTAGPNGLTFPFEHCTLR